MPAFITAPEQVIDTGRSMVSSMHKPGRILAKCLNCGITFSIDKDEYIMRMHTSELPGLFHVRTCMEHYRETHRPAHAMKQRILEINQRAKQ